MIRLLYLIGFLFVFENLNAQRLEYNQTPPLTWELFKAKAPRSNPYSAMTYSSIKLWMNSEGNNLSITIESFFESNRSWVKSDKKNEYLLNHEQRHFDLTEVYARILREKVLAKQLSFKNAGSYLEKTHRKTVNKLEKIQKKYDRQTKHSQIKTKQNEWDSKIDQLLKEHSKTQIKISKTLL